MRLVFCIHTQAKWVMDLLPKIESVDIKRLCGGRIIVKKKERDIGNQDKRAEEAAKKEVCNVRECSRARERERDQYRY